MTVRNFQEVVGVSVKGAPTASHKTDRYFYMFPHYVPVSR